MADKGACRRAAEVVYRDTTTGNAYAAHTYLGTNHFRDTFSGGADATTVIGTRAEEGPQDPDGLGLAKWSSTYFVDGTAIPDLHFSLVSGNLGIRRQTAQTTGAAAINAGIARGAFFSQEWRWTEAPPLGGFIALGFNCRAPGPAVTDSRLDTSSSIAQHWTNGWSIWGGRDSTNAYAKLFKNGVQVGASITLVLPAAGDTFQAEAWIRGAGTVADPTRIIVWLNGTLFWDITDSDDPYAAQTYVHGGMAGTAGIASSLVWDNFFITDVPSAPGAIRDFSTVWAELPIDVADAGTTVTLKTRMGRCAGSTLTDAPTEAQLSLLDPQGAVVWTGATFAVASYVTTDVALTADGLVTGAARSGLFRPVLKVADPGGLTTWNYDSEGAGSAAPTGTALDHVRGYAVARTTLDVTVPATIAAYPDSFTVSVALGATGYGTDRPLIELLQLATVRHSDTPAAWSGASVSTTDACDNAYEVEQRGVGIDLSFATAPAVNNSDVARVFSAVPVGYTTAVSAGQVLVTSPEDRFSVDPRIFITTQIQVDDATYGTPPGTKSNNESRLTSQLGFIASRLENIRGEGLNGLTIDQAIWDDGQLVGDPVTPARERLGQVTSTQGTEAGWVDRMLTWDNVLPAGTWQTRCSITAPATAVGLEDTSPHPMSLLAVNPDFQVVVGAGHPAASTQDEHWHPGHDLLIGAAMYNRKTRKLQPLDSLPAPTVVIGRFNTSLGAAQYLDATYAWVTLTGTAEAHKHSLTASAGDPNVWVTQIPGANTMSWDHSTMFFVCVMSVNATPYSGTTSLEATGASKPHGTAFEVITAGGPTDIPEHWTPGQPFQAGLSVVDMTSKTLIAPDGYIQIALFRLQSDGVNAGLGEYLDALGAWVPLDDASDVIHFFDITETRPGSRVYVKTFTDTATWGTHDIFVLGRVKHGLFEFTNFFKEIGVGPVNGHEKYVFDGAGFLGFPLK